MSLPGLLIEYLISGVIATIWIGALLAFYGKAPISLTDLDGSHVTLLLPVAYVLGTWVDHIGRVLTRSLDPERGHRGKTPPAPTTSTNAVPIVESTAGTHDPARVPTFGKEEMFARAPEVGKQYELRKSRDRVARGIFTNMVMLGIAGTVALIHRQPDYLLFWIPSALFAILISFRVWQKAVELSINFRSDAAEALAGLQKQTSSPAE